MSNQNNNIPEGFKMTELGPLPKEWRWVRIADIATTVKGRKPKELTQVFEKDCLPYLTAEYFRTFAPSQFVRLQECDSSIVVNDDDIAFIWDGSNAGDVFCGLKGVLASTMVKIIPRSEVIRKAFLYFFLKIQFDLFNSMTTGSTIPHVNKEPFQNLPIPLPPLAEQEAIAQVLSRIQKAIETQDKVIAAARELKKSLMRYLFTYGPVPVAEAEKVPLKETEIGPVPEHSEVVRLGEKCAIKGGKRLPKGHAFADEPTAHPYIRIVDFKNGSVDLSNLKFLTDEDFRAISRHTITCDDIYISIAGTIGLVGTIPNELDGANLTENAARLVINQKNGLNKDFLKYALSTESQQQQISQLTSKTSQPKLALARIQQIVIPLPTICDQQEIARILTAVDTKIEAEERRKAAVQTLFKTMLHLLMTGKVRVKDLEAQIA
jgi:type I restriction enzyme S subunit